MRRERAIWLASIMVAVLIAAIGLTVAGSGQWLHDRYEQQNRVCSIRIPPETVKIPKPDLSGSRSIIIDLRASGTKCHAGKQRTELGFGLTTVGALLMVGGGVFLVLVLVRGGRVLVRGGGRAGPARPTGKQSRSLGALLAGVGRSILVVGGIGFLLLLFGAIITDASPFKALYMPKPGDREYKNWATPGSMDWAYAVLYIGLAALCGVLVKVGGSARGRGRRHLQASAEELLATDPRPPVLYLRSFEADDVMAASTGDGDSAEEALVAALSMTGPVVALGEPGEALPPLGAARAYTADAHWQLHISDWAEEARLIVLLAGRTDAFWWEVRHLAASGALGKSIFLLPGGKAYASFRDRFIETVPGTGLPAALKGTDTLFSVAGILRFEDRVPRLKPIALGPMTKKRWLEVLAGPDR
jgi:hypothetical protein